MCVLHIKPFFYSSTSSTPSVRTDSSQYKAVIIRSSVRADSSVCTNSRAIVVKLEITDLRMRISPRYSHFHHKNDEGFQGFYTNISSTFNCGREFDESRVNTYIRDVLYANHFTILPTITQAVTILEIGLLLLWCSSPTCNASTQASSPLTFSLLFFLRP